MKINNPNKIWYEKHPYNISLTDKMAEEIAKQLDKMIIEQIINSAKQEFKKNK